MKKITVAVVFGILMGSWAFMHTSCTYQNQEDLFPEEGICDTSLVLLSADVRPILMGNCYDCHSASMAGASGAGINLEDHGTLRAYGLNGRLICSIEHGNGCSHMPKGLSKLPQCDIDKIKAWVSRGAQND